MMRKMFLLLLLTGMISSVKAQWSLKPETGVMLIKSNNNYKWNTRFTIGLGGEYEWKAGNIDLGLQSGLYYTQRGYQRFVSHVGKDEYNNINRGFIQLPVKLNLYIPLCDQVRMVVGFGPYVGYDVNTSWGYGQGYHSTYPGEGYGHNYGSPGGTYAYDRPTIKKWDYGVGANVGIEFKKVLLSMAYDMSLGKELEKQKNGLRYHNLTFTVGYRFKMGR